MISSTAENSSEMPSDNGNNLQLPQSEARGQLENDQTRDQDEPHISMSNLMSALFRSSPSDLTVLYITFIVLVLFKILLLELLVFIFSLFALRSFKKETERFEQRFKVLELLSLILFGYGFILWSAFLVKFFGKRDIGNRLIFRSDIDQEHDSYHFFRSLFIVMMTDMAAIVIFSLIKSIILMISLPRSKSSSLRTG